jgi:hypothetical protein
MQLLALCPNSVQRPQRLLRAGSTSEWPLIRLLRGLPAFVLISGGNNSSAALSSSLPASESSSLAALPASQINPNSESSNSGVSSRLDLVMGG